MQKYLKRSTGVDFGFSLRSIVFAIVAAGAIVLAFFVFFRPDTSLDLKVRFLACTTPGDHTRHETGTCLRKLAHEAVSSKAVTSINADLSAMTDPRARSWCHEFMHYAGWELYDRTHSLADSFREASNLCDSGMLHGIVEEYALTSSDRKGITDFAKNVAPTLCVSEDVNARLSLGGEGTCHHGLGHAYMFLTDNDLGKSLSYCDLLHEVGRGACFAGAYMENIQGKQVGRVATSAVSVFTSDNKNPDAPCDTLEEKYKAMCYRFKGSSAITGNKDGVLAAMKICSRLDRRYRDSCYWGAGNNIPSPTVSSVEAAYECTAAQKITERAYRQCLDGALSFVVQQSAGKVEEADAFCNAVPARLQSNCYRMAVDELRNWIKSPKTMQNICTEFVTDVAQKICNESAV